MKVVRNQFRAPVIVWVEDAAAKATLELFWSDARFQFAVAHGGESVRQIVRGTEGFTQWTVFGVVDRDFDADDQAEWETLGKRLFRLPVHETENLLLSFDALSRHARESRDEIEVRARSRAQELLMWMTVKSVLREGSGKIGGRFPEDPSPHATRTLESAKRFILEHPCWLATDSARAAWLKGVDGFLSETHRGLDQGLQNGDWLHQFSGKEIFRHIRGTTTGLKGAVDGATGADERDLDLIKRVAATMKNENLVPPAMTRLHEVIKSKAGIP